MKDATNFETLTKGQLVEVTSLQGIEIGEVDSINYKTGKVTVYFNYEACPHFDTFNLSQVKAFNPKLVSEDSSFPNDIQKLTPTEKSQLADKIYNHIIEILDEKIKDQK